MIEMDMPEIIKSRRSVRTFDGTPLTAEHKAKLEEFISTISAPYDIPIEFVLLEKEKYGLSSPVISGESMYVAAKSKAVPHSEEAFGYAFEQENRPLRVILLSLQESRVWSLLFVQAPVRRKYRGHPQRIPACNYRSYP